MKGPVPAFQIAVFLLAAGLSAGCGTLSSNQGDGRARSVEALFQYRHPGPLLRQAAADCAAGRRVLMLASPEVNTIERLTTLSRVSETSPGCQIVTARAPHLSGNPWTYVAWRPARYEGMTPQGAPRPPPVEVQQLHGKSARSAAGGRAKFLGCGPGQAWLQVFPPDIRESRRKRVMSTLPAQAGCQKVEAYQDKIPRPQGRVSLVLGRRIRHLTHVETPDATLGQEEGPPRRARKASFEMLEIPVRFGNGGYLALKPGRRVGGRGRVYEHMGGKGPTIVAMFASWCTACLKAEELKLVKRLAWLSKARGVRFLNMADGQGEVAAELRKLRHHARAKQFVYPVLVIKDRLVNLKENVTPFEAGLPLFLVMDGRKIHAYRFGTLDEQVIVDLVEAALAPTSSQKERQRHMRRVLAAAEPAPAPGPKKAVRPSLEMPTIVPEEQAQPAPAKIAAKPIAVQPKPKPSPGSAGAGDTTSSTRTWGWVLSSAGAAMLVGSAVTIALGETRVSPYDDMDPNRVVQGGLTQVEAEQAGTFATTMRFTALGLGIAGAAALTSGVVMLMRKGSVRGRIVAPSMSDGEPTVRITPLGTGASVEVVF